MGKLKKMMLVMVASQNTFILCLRPKWMKVKMTTTLTLLVKVAVVDVTV